MGKAGTRNFSSSSGTKRGLLTEVHGVPTGVVVDCAYRVDARLVEPTIASRPVEHYLAMLRLAGAFLTYRTTEIF